ncbi:MAG: hypothetical protein O7D91_04630 [Planctomycetota bacterium]|nr:hypothetical protein [Planctomycetota bacterium]
MFGTAIRLLRRPALPRRNRGENRKDSSKTPALRQSVRLAELDRLAASQAEINSIVTDALQFISGLKFTFNQGLPQEKLCALRQCVERILIDKPSGAVIVKIKAVPASAVQEVEELARELNLADAVVPQ